MPTPATRLACLALLALGLVGCASNDFTLEADLPGDFKFTGDALYVTTTNSACTQQSRHRLFETSGNGERPRRISFVVPLKQQLEGCNLELSGISIELGGSSQPVYSDGNRADIALAGLVVRDRLPAGEPGMPSEGTLIFDGQCRWTTPADGSVRTLQCHASDLQGNWFEGAPGGVVQRNQLAGRTVRLAIAMPAELPELAGGTHP
ncbi:hypothetical protein [Pseudomonas sp. SCB32]|uniref:hypothetical protein n=1 Tax=Pseudomonas sp. SCB32 TaxID=2653853 RepID=UPI0012652915|nr:hypothetical protein [Pseudomonas sp. SCB32]